MAMKAVLRRGCGVAVLCSLLVAAAGQAGHMSFGSPMFFRCYYPGESDQSTLDRGEVSLSVSIEGNPTFYTPGRLYQVNIRSSQDFDGFHLIGLYSVSANHSQLASVPWMVPRSPPTPSAPTARSPDLQCSMLLHSHLGNSPVQDLHFVWPAPPKDSGCINFKATAMFEGQVLFKDITVLQLCEEGAEVVSPPRPDLAMVHEHGVILRDDFDSSDHFDEELWSSHLGFSIGDQCGTIRHGQSAVACEAKGNRSLVSVPLNLTSASVLQFTMASGTCNPAVNGEQVHVLYGTDACSSWTVIDSVDAPPKGAPILHLLHLPMRARQQAVCLKWEEEPVANDTNSRGCWAMDNVLVVNLAAPPGSLHEDFDPVDPSNWLFFPGAEVQSQCLAESNSLIFDDPHQKQNFVVTRDLQLKLGDEEDLKDALLTQHFEGELPKGWSLRGGVVGTACGTVDSGRSVVMDGEIPSRILCTPYLDMTLAGNLKFSFTFGDGACSNDSLSESKVFTYVEDLEGHSTSLTTLTREAHPHPRLLSLPVPPEARQESSRVCWTQKSHGGALQDVWAVDSVRLLPDLPENPRHFVQFQLNLNCGDSVRNTSLALEYSTDHGHHWHALYPLCHSMKCLSMTSMLKATFGWLDYKSWTRTTLPLPHAALTGHVRLRWRQANTGDSRWAIDDVYVGECLHGCSGHGACSGTGCSCDDGYKGPSCSQTTLPLASMLVEPMTTVGSVMTNFDVIDGASLGYDCGLVSSGKAAVFHREGARILETMDLNTTGSRFVQFSVRVGSESLVGRCPPPDHEDEAVLLHYTCDGGIMWKLLRDLPIKGYTEPMVVSVILPAEAKQSVCRFRWSQPVHSGRGRDVWAVDDVSVTSSMYNSVSLDFTDTDKILQTLDVHLGHLGGYCGRTTVLSFTDSFQEGEARYVTTNSLTVGPSYVLQFHLVIGCSYHFVPELKNAIHLEYSTNHGMTWTLVRGGCWPPAMCKEDHEATVYYASEFKTWTRVTVLLPPHTWSMSTRFRLRQSTWGASDSWAVANLYIGLQCPDLCQGHGYCDQGQCRCEEGYSGPTCSPEHPLPTSLTTDFSFMSQLDSDWSAVIGGDIAGANQGCGIMLSGESMFFFKEGPRKLVSVDLNTSHADFVQFYLQLGGANDIQCFGIDTRDENVLLQYSVDGGTTWRLIKELQGLDYRTPKFVHLPLPEQAKQVSTRLRWWQPHHSGAGTDHWAVDEVHLGRYLSMRQRDEDFELRDSDASTNGSGAVESLWLTQTEGMYAPYCGSVDDTLMFAGQPNDQFAMTKDFDLSPGDIIQFKINVGCSKTFSSQRPVLLQYSHDSGVTWHLVEEPCYQAELCHGHPSQGTVYHAGPYGEWRLLVIPVTDQVASRQVNFRWWQSGGSTGSFALNDLYIGPPCPHMCRGHGLCTGGHCLCEPGFEGKDCSPLVEMPQAMIDRFEDRNRPGQLWERILGGHLGLGCGTVASGSSMYFDGEGSREARTVALNTTNIRSVQFAIRIGTPDSKHGCRKPSARKEGVIVDYSTDNGITWEILKFLDPELYVDKPEVVNIELPPASKGPMTVVRWWQPLSDEARAEWALDDVIVAVNDTSEHGFQENFSPMKKEVWYMAMNAIPRITCHSKDNALEFSKNGKMRYAETWDYHVSPSTFLQFDIAMGCSGTYSALYSVMLQYSTDMGRSWHPVVDECLPPRDGCAGYHLSSNLLSQAHANWTRVTLYLPPRSVSRATRFRWLQETVALRGNVWALDNIYLGEGCPWMCSGHGYCDQGTCVCDAGYFGPFCVPYKQLPMNMKSSFEDGIPQNDWPEVYGGEATKICGLVVAGKTLTFYKENLRMAVTKDLDVSMATFLQFIFQYGCDHVEGWQRDKLVLLQYSNNGGVLWNPLEDIFYPADNSPRYFNIRLPTAAQTNATRFRFWQPQHDGLMKSVWSLDDFYVGGSPMNLDMLYETFDQEPNPEHWLFWPGGETGQYCSFSARADTLLASRSAMVFHKGRGEKSITTADINVNEMTVVQFDLNVGCTEQSSSDLPVRLEYSVDYGKTWQLVVSPCAGVSHLSCVEQQHDATIYYSGSTKYWRRVVVPLSGMHLCGAARFRWYQGHFYTADQESFIPEWAIKNVYIGMQCLGHCGGHGTCIRGLMCQCDEHYDGSSTCVPTQKNPTFLLDDFDEESEVRSRSSSSRWWIVSGGETTEKCGRLLSGQSMHFIGWGLRALESHTMDLSQARLVQFYLRLGCSSTAPSPLAQPVLLQYSVDGGITWHTIEQFDFTSGDDGSSQVRYVVLDLPHAARSATSKLRWIQPTMDGLHREQWAIDQIYIGGHLNGLLALQDDLSNPQRDAWLMHPGARVEPTCGLQANSLHFAGGSEARFAVTNDVVVTEATYLQFYLSMGCGRNGKCYGVELEYSLDQGRTWQMVEQECMPSDPDCNHYHSSSVFTSEVYNGWHRVTVQLPYYTRSPSTRFRWIQKPAFMTSDSWAITNVYLGDECMCSCAGHGRCNRGVCVCDVGWGGEGCSETLEALPTLVSDTFTGVPEKLNWLGIHGATLTLECGVLTSGVSLHFKGECARQLITTDIDLREALFIHFHVKFGCISAPTQRDEGVLIDYSTNGGTEWHKVIELYYDQYKEASYVMVELPKGSKKNGVRIRWWQPHHPGQSKSDWAIDNIVIGGKETNPNEVKDTFSDGVRKYLWLQNDNVKYGEYCGSKFSVTGVPQTKEKVTLMTADIDVRDGYILQFSISVGCNASWDADIAPVHLQYSTDYGMTWRHLVVECLPFYPMCNGHTMSPSVYYASKGWRRITIPLTGPVVSKASRLRWHQSLDPASPQATSRQHWALDDVYISPACADLCGGHGHCDYPVCICDSGYGGENCRQVQPIETYLRDSFESGLDEHAWSLVQGGHISRGCQELVEGTGLHFTGPGQRQAATVDLDLRNARFVQYYAMIGGPSTLRECGPPQSRNESVILQYSTNAGIRWENLHVLDYRHYWRAPKKDYIPLPSAARTNSTRVRWWQTVGDAPGPPRGWTLDDVYIGGNEINPSEMYETFDIPSTLTSVEFAPGGHIESDVCGRRDPVLSWRGKSNLRSLITQQLIVQEGYILQFKMVIGCGQPVHSCDTTHAVRMLYSVDPETDAWDMVHPPCMWNSHETNMECTPYHVHQGTTYTANTHLVWKQVTVRLPPKVFSAQTRFQLQQQQQQQPPPRPGGEADTASPSWAVDDVYIGEQCPELCRGRGDCVRGKCRCNPGYQGDTCRPIRSQLLSHMMDGFEAGVSAYNWEEVNGGGIGLGCGTLLPLAHGKNLYFSGCGIRQAITAEMDTTKASKVLFVLQIGSHRQSSSCNVDLQHSAGNGMVLLQYTKNKGIDWHLLATHEAREFLTPRRVGYDLTHAARGLGVQFRWWQPDHRGVGHDQWAIDHVEIIMTRQPHLVRSTGSQNLVMKQDGHLRHSRTLV